MGGVENDEPPPKRVKVSSKLRSCSSVSLTAGVANGLGGMKGKHLPYHGSEELVGPRGMIRRVEFVRIITNALYSLGYENSGALLEEESGINLHSSIVNVFRGHLLDGNWDECRLTLCNLGVTNEMDLKSASFLILEQKFFEFLWNNELAGALKTLRSQIAPLGVNSKRVRELSACVICPSLCSTLGFDVQGVAIVDSRMKVLEGLQKWLPSTVMVPERRLEYLVEQALTVQREACIFHNSLDSSLSLYSDHQCGKDQIPSRTIQVLHSHNDDVYFLRFSNKGKFLASASSDKSAIIWEIHEDGTVSLKHTLIGHQKPVHMLAWSPDDSMLLTCGLPEVVRCWDVRSGECIRAYEKTSVGQVSCGWFPDGKTIITGLMDKSICMWDLDGKELENWKGHRTIMISDIAVTTDNKWIMTICKENAILLYNREAKVEKYVEEGQAIISFTISKDDKSILVNLINGEIHLWSLSDNAKLLLKYQGHKRSRFVIRSCFGGVDESFIASGSEDSQVYVWHRASGELIEKLPGHSGSVNCVSWNPANPHMLASGSDDHTIRIWGLHRDDTKDKDTGSNGVPHCNGKL